MYFQGKQKLITGLVVSGLVACSSFSTLAAEQPETQHRLATYATDNGALYLSESRPGKRSSRSDNTLQGNRGSRAAGVTGPDLGGVVFYRRP